MRNDPLLYPTQMRRNRRLKQNRVKTRKLEVKYSPASFTEAPCSAIITSARRIIGIIFFILRWGFIQSSPCLFRFIPNESFLLFGLYIALLIKESQTFLKSPIYCFAILDHLYGIFDHLEGKGNHKSNLETTVRKLQWEGGRIPLGHQPV